MNLLSKSIKNLGNYKFLQQNYRDDEPIDEIPTVFYVYTEIPVKFYIFFD